MPKVKYKFNPDTLTYEKFKRTRSHWFFRIGGIFSVSVVGFIGLFLIADSIILSPNEKRLKREINNFKTNYGLLTEKVNQLERVIEDLEYRDNNIYRSVFEAEPIPFSIRNAGFGGVEKYRSLEGYENSDLIILSTKKIDRISKKLYVLSKSFDEIEVLAANKKEWLDSRPAIQPINNKELTRLSSLFGWRVHPILKIRKMHEGIDLTAPRGTKVYATGNGKVTKAEYTRGGYGNVVEINHGYGYKTVYAHLQKIHVFVGQKIKRGQVIGTVGNTGLSTAPHLHYEVRKNNIPVNPIHFFYNDLSPEDYNRILEMAEREQ
jgi:murein DD-endopeptidase MepM/ murein hydrolase activator NlpD